MKEFEWFELFEWFGPSPTEPFNSAAGARVVERDHGDGLARGEGPVIAGHAGFGRAERTPTPRRALHLEAHAASWPNP